MFRTGRIGFENGGVTSFGEAMTPQGKVVFNRLITEHGMTEQEARQRIMGMIQSGSQGLGNLGLMDHFAIPPRQENMSGGRVGRMGGGMMIMGDNGVVNNGIGGIMKKYQQIRSEL